MSFAPVDFSDHDDGDEQIVAEINVTPLTDIFLVLLIIFMVTSTALTQQATSVRLPRAGAGGSRPAGVVVTATANQRIEVDGKPVDVAHLGSAIAARLKETSLRNVILHGDRQVVLERAIEIMSIAKRAGAERIAIATVPVAAPPAD